MADEAAVDPANGPLFVVFGLYIVGITGAAVFGFFKNKSDMGGKDEKAMEAHFMGGKGFGALVMFLTYFSTQYSGYTIAGIPKEASGLGFLSLRWLSGMSVCMLMVPVLIPRCGASIPSSF